VKKLIQNFKKLNIYLKIILFFTVIGFGKNVYLFFTQGADVIDGYRLYGGFALIFGSQILFLLLRDWRASIFSAAQCFFALFLYEDFTFLPVVKPIFYFFMYAIPDVNFEQISSLQYIMTALLFSLEVLKTYLIYDFLTVTRHEKKR